MTLEKAKNILELNDGYLEKDLRKQHRFLSKMYHTDNSITGNEEKIQQINEAYSFLIKNSPNDSKSETVYERKSTMTNTKKCTKCNGSGQMYKKCRSAGKLRLTTVKCDLCRGKGIIYE